MNQQGQDFSRLYVSEVAISNNMQTSFNNFKRILIKCQDESWKEWSFFNKKRLEYQKEYHSRLSKHQTRTIRENVNKIWKCFCSLDSAVELRVLENDSAQLGIFATRTIKANTRIPLLIGWKTFNKCNLDSMIPDPRYENVGFDGPIFFVNHSQTPNCKWTKINKKIRYSRVISKRDIQIGEQITIHYGREYWTNATPSQNYQ